MRSRSFAWKALDQEGNVREGIWEVQQGTEVRSRLFAKGYYPLAIVFRRWRVQELIAFLDYQNKKSDRLRIWADITQRLSILLKSGIPLLSAIEILAKQSKGSRITRLAWDGVKEQLEAGVEFSEALGALVPQPTPYIRAMIQAGERAGRLPEVLESLSQELLDEHNYGQKLRGALAYPVFLLVLTLGIIYALSQVVLPVYEQIFANMGAELSFLTRVIFMVSHGLPYLTLLFALMLVIALLILRIREPNFWREKLRDALSCAPLFGQVYRLNDYRRFSQVLGTLLEAGIPLLEALRLTQGTVLTYSMKSLVRELGEAARAGRGLTAMLAGTKDFPEDATQMLEIGEESGQLSDMLQHLSRMFQMDLEGQMNKVPHLLGPLLIILLAGIIGLVAVGVLLPIFDIGTHLQ